MSKMDGLRAMREAKYAERMALRTKPAASPPAPARRVAGPDPRPSAEPEPSVEDGLCGHRAISGRTCTRERGHAAKSHRYT